MQLKKSHTRILQILMDGGDQVGMSIYEIGERFGAHGLAFSRPFNTLDRRTDYIEARWKGNPWPGEKQAPDTPPTQQKRQRRFYRLTAKGKTLARRST